MTLKVDGLLGPYRLPLLLLLPMPLSPQKTNPKVIGENNHNTPVVPEKELIQTVLCPRVFKPCEETLDVGASPNPDNTDLRSSGSNL